MDRTAPAHHLEQVGGAFLSPRRSDLGTQGPWLPFPHQRPSLPSQAFEEKQTAMILEDLGAFRVWGQEVSCV